MTQMDENYTRLSNDVIEALSRTNLTAHEWRVLCSILRKTYGFQKKDDWITSSQIAEMTGLHRAHVSRAKGLLVLRNIVTPRGNKIGLNKYHNTWKQLPHGVNNHQGKSVTPRGTPVTPRGISELPHGVHTKETPTKETIQKKPSSMKKGPHPGVQAIMQAMRENFGDLDDSEAKNRQYAWNLLRKAKMDPSPCVALIRAAAKHDFWGQKITRVEHLYKNAHRIANDLREGGSKVAIIS